MVSAVVLLGNGQSVLCVALADRAALEPLLRNVPAIGTERLLAGGLLVSHFPLSPDVRLGEGAARHPS